MNYPPEALALKDGLTVTLRSPVEADAPVSLAYLKAIMGETDFLSSYADEIGGSLDTDGDRGRCPLGVGGAPRMRAKIAEARRAHTTKMRGTRNSRAH